MEYEAVIGLEVHCQLLTRSKIFCGCATAFGDPPNTHTCPVCLGLPGALPVLNRQAVAMAVKTALALGCRINPLSVFARKNYFYPDLPKGYQISQYDLPVAEDGIADVWSGVRSASGAIVDHESKRFRIKRLHLEEDAGKSVHAADGSSYVNLNRTGVPLIEIVSEPDFRTSQEAYDYLGHLRRTVMYLGVCDGNLEEGSLRCDANVSVRPVGQDRLGTKAEIKNLNSLRFLQRALDHEIERQVGVLGQGGEVRQETRLWNEDQSRTIAMRGKEEAQDYRYFPEPDLPPLRLSESWLEEMAGEIPELPEPKRLRFVSRYALSDEEAQHLCQSLPAADYFEEAASHAPAKPVYNWMVGELTRALKSDSISFQECPLPAAHLGQLIRMVQEGAISGSIAKDVFEQSYREKRAPERIVAERGLLLISDESELESLVDSILAENPGKVAAYREGKTGLMGFFVGQAMRLTEGQADPRIVNGLLKRKLDES